MEYCSTEEDGIYYTFRKHKVHEALKDFLLTFYEGDY